MLRFKMSLFAFEILVTEKPLLPQSRQVIDSVRLQGRGRRFSGELFFLFCKARPFLFGRIQNHGGEPDRMVHPLKSDDSDIGLKANPANFEMAVEPALFHRRFPDRLNRDSDSTIPFQNSDFMIGYLNRAIPKNLILSPEQDQADAKQGC